MTSFQLLWILGDTFVWKIYFYQGIALGTFATYKVFQLDEPLFTPEANFCIVLYKFLWTLIFWNASAIFVRLSNEIFLANAANTAN